MEDTTLLLGVVVFVFLYLLKGVTSESRRYVEGKGILSEKEYEAMQEKKKRIKKYHNNRDITANSSAGIMQTSILDTDNSMFDSTIVGHTDSSFFDSGSPVVDTDSSFFDTDNSMFDSTIVGDTDSSFFDTDNSMFGSTIVGDINAGGQIEDGSFKWGN